MLFIFLHIICQCWIGMKPEVRFYNIFMYLYNKNILEYAQIAQSYLKKMLITKYDLISILVMPHQGHQINTLILGAPVPKKRSGKNF